MRFKVLLTGALLFIVCSMSFNVSAQTGYNDVYGSGAGSSDASSTGNITGYGTNAITPYSTSTGSASSATTSVGTVTTSSNTSSSYYFNLFRCIFGHYHDIKLNDGHQSCPWHKTVPFDGGLTLLLTAGVAYGFKRGRRQKNIVTTEK